MRINWKAVRFVFGVFGIVVVVAAVMSAGVLSQLGVSVPDDEPAAPVEQGAAAPADDAGEPDAGQSAEGSFWDDVLAAKVVKGQIDRAAETEDCDELDRLAELHSRAYGMPEDSRRELLGYIVGHQLRIGC